MSVKINLGAWNSVFAVPSKIVDEGLKFSDGVKLKVLLYVLRNADRQLDTESISAATGVNVTDIPEALEYWVNMGILAKNNDVLSPIESKSSDIKTEPVQETMCSPLKGLRWTRNLKSLFRKLGPLSEKRCQIPTPQRF